MNIGILIVIFNVIFLHKYNDFCGKLADNSQKVPKSSF